MSHHLLQRYLERSKQNRIDPEKRHRLFAEGQHPNAVVLCCSDSRVVPELIFDADIGELFVIRTAGNSLGENEYRSIEYACCHLHVHEVYVLGHTNCGAVAEVLAGKYQQNPLLFLLHQNIGDEADPKNASITNAKQVKKQIKERLNNDQISVSALLYDIDDGSVTLL